MNEKGRDLFVKNEGAKNFQRVGNGNRPSEKRSEAERKKKRSRAKKETRMTEKFSDIYNIYIYYLYTRKNIYIYLQKEKYKKEKVFHRKKECIMDQERLTHYWLDIPVGRDRAIRYSELCDLWKVTRRRAREILQELALYPLDDGFILIRSSHSAGFYKTDDPEEIKAFRLECLSRGRACLAPIAKINRVLRDQLYTFDLLTALDQVEAADDSC